MKKIFALSTVLAISALSAEATPFSSGFFAGLHMGGSQHRVKFNQSYYSGTVANRTIVAQASRSMSNFFGGATLGYRHSLSKNFTVALLLQADFFDSSALTITSTDGQNNPFKNAYRRNWAIMSEMIFGYTWNKKWHTGIGFGVPHASFSTETTYTNNTRILKANKTLTGFSTNLHVNYAITHNIFVSAAFGYEWFPNLNVVWGPELTPGVNGTQYSSRLKLGGIKGQLGVSYRF